jgi:hypothetical protein
VLPTIQSSLTRRAEGTVANRDRHVTIAAIALPFFFLMMSGLARANVIVVNTTDSGSDPAPLCTLEDAVTAANEQGPVHGCAAGTGGDDTIVFTVTGPIALDNTLMITDPVLEISGALFGGITIDGGGSKEIIDAENDILFLESVTLANGIISEPNFDGAAVGGAIFEDGDALFVEDCTFRDNEAFAGGAIFGVDASLIYILNSTFAGNEAVLGGAIYDYDAGLLMTNSTFSGNEAEPTEGGALATNLGESFVNSSIFSHSISGGNCDGIDDDGYNISDDDSCGFSGTSVDGSTSLKLDPLGLQNNGGPTQTIALESGSQAINFIPIASCDDLLFDEPVTTDQRGYGRPSPGNPNFCDAGAYEFDAVAPFVLVPNTERVQIARSSSANSDQVNLAATFTENGAPTCEPDQDALNSGIDVALYAGECAGALSNGLQLTLNPFAVSTVNHESYGTLYQTFAPAETVSARMVALQTPASPACGQWTLNLEVSDLDTASLGLGGGNPFALVLTTVDGDFAGCFDITNAIVGNQIPPPTRTVRRGVRR